jgi:hypothetical protein
MIIKTNTKARQLESAKESVKPLRPHYIENWVLRL